MQSIVIATTPGREAWLKDCLESLKGQTTYPVLILSDFSWEAGKIKFMRDRTDIEEFFLLHDTCIVKDLSIFERAFKFPGGYAMAPDFMMYLGKYRREALVDTFIPEVTSKAESVKQEGLLNEDYMANEEQTFICEQPMIDTSKFVQRHGRKNMVIENDYLIKYKGTWSPEGLE